MDWIFYVISAVLVIGALAGGFFGGIRYRKNVAEREIGSAEEES